MGMLRIRKRKPIELPTRRSLRSGSSERIFKKTVSQGETFMENQTTTGAPIHWAAEMHAQEYRDGKLNPP